VVLHACKKGRVGTVPLIGNRLDLVIRLCPFVLLRKPTEVLNGTAASMCCGVACMLSAAIREYMTDICANLSTSLGGRRGHGPLWP